MRDIIFILMESFFILCAFGCVLSMISFKRKAKQNHFEKKECDEINEKVKKMKIWKMPSRIFAAISLISFAVGVVGIALFVVYFVYMLAMFVVGLFAAVMSHAKTETGDVLDLIWNYWKYCGIWGFPSLLVSATFYMMRQFYVSRVKLKLLEERINEK